MKSGFYYRGLLDTTDDDYKEVSENPALFEGIEWEPGRSFGYDFKVVNEGSLAFDYEISLQNIEFAGNNNVNIADVIDVYVIGIGDTSLNGQPHNSLAYYIDKQHSVIRGGKVTTENKEHRFSIVFKMKETAGNEYQGASIDFDIVLKAKQAVWEEDGFGSSDYDKDAVYDQVNVDATGDAAANGAKLQEAINNATPGSIVFVGAGEYDAPLTERIDDPQRLHDIFGILSEFFQLLQSSEAALRFLFVTGVCAAGSLASLTRLDDISLRPEFSALLGFTQSEIERRFSAHVQAAASRMNCDELQVLKQLNSRYGGFCFSEEAYERVLCP